VVAIWEQTSSDRSVPGVSASCTFGPCSVCLRVRISRALCLEASSFIGIPPNTDINQSNHSAGNMAPEKSSPAFESGLKHPKVCQEKGDAKLGSTLAGRKRPFVIGLATIALLYFLWLSTIAGIPFAARYGFKSCHSHGHAESKTPVPLEAHIMSKCPDALDCLRMMVLPTMERMHSKVNFTLSYIGT
jgi:hypothetical protein